MKEINRLSVSDLSTTSPHTDDQRHRRLTAITNIHLTDHSSEQGSTKTESTLIANQWREIVYDGRFACY